MREKIQKKIAIEKYEAEAQGLFPGCENDCLTTVGSTHKTAQESHVVGGPAISLCFAYDDTCVVMPTPEDCWFW